VFYNLTGVKPFVFQRAMQAYKKCCVPIAFVQMCFMQQFIAQIKELFKFEATTSKKYSYLPINSYILVFRSEGSAMQYELLLLLLLLFLSTTFILILHQKVTRCFFPGFIMPSSLIEFSGC